MNARSVFRVVAHVAALLLTVSPSVSQFAIADEPRAELDRYAMRAPIELQANEGLQRLELPLPVLQASRSANLADVHVFDAKGEPVPIAWAEAPSIDRRERSLPLPRFAWPQRADNSTAPAPGLKIELNTMGAVVRVESPGNARIAPAAKLAPRTWLLDLSAAPSGERLDRIELDWKAHDGGLSTSVTVEASDDARSWSTAGHWPLLVLAGSDPNSPALKAVPWPASGKPPRYLRLSFDTPLALTRSDAVLSTAAPAALSESPVRFRYQAPHDAEPAQWLLDLQGSVALRGLTLRLPATNTVVPLRLQRRDDASQPWSDASRFVAWRLTREGRESASAGTSFEAPAARYWRLLADATAGSADFDATIAWRLPQLVVVARGDGLRLAVGRAKDRAATMPLASLMPNYEAGAELHLPAARLGALQAFVPAPRGFADASDEDKRRWALWAVLIVAVGGLGWLARRLIREMAAPHKE